MTELRTFSTVFLTIELGESPVETADLGLPESVLSSLSSFSDLNASSSSELSPPSIRHSAFTPESDTVTVELNGESCEAVVRDAVSNVPEGSLAIVPGSAGGDDPYQELFLRGGSAASTFGTPGPGEALSIRAEQA